MSGIDLDALLDLLQRFGRTLLRDYAVEEAFEAFGDRVADTIGVAGAGVMIEDDNGDLRFVAATGHALTRLEELQIELGEGPCLLAFQQSRTVLSPDLCSDDRFPRFRGPALEAGLAAVYSFALRVDDTTIGAMNLYATTPGDLDDVELRTAEVLADVATTYLLHARDLRAAREQVEGLESALQRRIAVEQGKGYLAAALGVSPEEARERIRAHARSRQRRVEQVARELVEGRLPPDAFAGSG